MSYSTAIETRQTISQLYWLTKYLAALIGDELADGDKDLITEVLHDAKQTLHVPTQTKRQA